MGGIRHLRLVVFFAILAIGLGTVGYMVVEGWSLMDALFMTVTTLSTVGYGEVQKLSTEGRILSMVLIVMGVGYFFYVAAAVVQFMVEGKIRQILGRKRLDRKIEHLRDHYIVCGYGRIGRILWRNVRQSRLPLVVIEKNPDLVPALEEDGALYILGDASDEGLLLKARIREARGLIAVLAEDADNVFLVLTARELNPRITILARACKESSIGKIKAAGADTVVSPYEIGASAMAHRIVRPTVTGFLDLALSHGEKAVQIEEIPVDQEAALVDVMLKDSRIRQDYDLIIIAIKSASGEMLFNPSFETVIRAGDTVIALGAERNLDRLKKVLSGPGLSH